MYVFTKNQVNNISRFKNIIDYKISNKKLLHNNLKLLYLKP